MSTKDLERPVWSTLNGPQGHLAKSFGLAVRIDPAFGPFAAAKDTSEEAQFDLSRLVRESGKDVWLVEREEWPAPRGTKTVRTAPLVQMVARGASDLPKEDFGIVPLGSADVPAMTELALATEPGPWAKSTHQYGPFFGIRDGQELAAMAGQRMRPAVGLAEVSGVCTWPQYRGQGMARKLIAHVMQIQRDQGDVPFLHSYAGNATAIGLYESLGFSCERELVVTVLSSD